MSTRTPRSRTNSTYIGLHVEEPDETEQSNQYDCANSSSAPVQRYLLQKGLHFEVYAGSRPIAKKRLRM